MVLKREKFTSPFVNFSVNFSSGNPGLQQLPLSNPDQLLVTRRVSNTCFEKTLATETAAVAFAARSTLLVRLVTGYSKAVINPSSNTGFDDLSLGHVDQWCFNAQVFPSIPARVARFAIF